MRELVIVGADQDGRWQRRPEHRAQTAQGLRPVVWGHPMIQQQHVVAASRRLLCHCALDSRGRVVEVVDLQPEHLQLLAQRQARFGEVVHQQRALSPQRRSRGVVVALDLQFGSEPEAAAGTGPAVDLSTPTWPPIIFAIWRVSASPRPVPPWHLEIYLSACSKASNSPA